MLKCSDYPFFNSSLQWRHNERDDVSNQQLHDCLLTRLFRRRSKKTSKLRVTGLCAGNSPAAGEFTAQMTSNADNATIWWRYHITFVLRANVIEILPVLTLSKCVEWPISSTLSQQRFMETLGPRTSSRIKLLHFLEIVIFQETNTQKLCWRSYEKW